MVISVARFNEYLQGHIDTFFYVDNFLIESNIYRAYRNVQKKSISFDCEAAILKCLLGPKLLFYLGILTVGSSLYQVCRSVVQVCLCHVIFVFRQPSTVLLVASLWGEKKRKDGWFL